MAPETRIARDRSAGGSRSETSARSALKGIFRKEGEYWSVDYGEKSFRLKDTKGFGYLAHLIRHPALEQAEVRRFHAKMLIDRSALGDRKMAQALLDRAAEIYSACRVISR